MPPGAVYAVIWHCCRPAPALTCTSDRRILPASCRRSAAPRYCCRWKELSRVLICSALNAVRSRRPPRGSSPPSSATGCPAPDGLPPAPGDSDRDERVSQVRPPPPRPSTAQRCLPRPGGVPAPPPPAREPRAVPVVAVPAVGLVAKLSLLLPPLPSRGPAG